MRDEKERIFVSCGGGVYMHACLCESVGVGVGGWVGECLGKGKIDR